MTKAKKPPVMITCDRCNKSLPKSESCSWREGRVYFRFCQDCTRSRMGLEPRKS